MVHVDVATVVTVVFGIGLGMTGYTIIWPLFGAANKLLAALALLAVCAWLGNAGKMCIRDRRRSSGRHDEAGRFEVCGQDWHGQVRRCEACRQEDVCVRRREEEGSA